MNSVSQFASTQPVLVNEYIASTTPVNINAQWLDKLPTNGDLGVVILQQNIGSSLAGMYSWNGTRWVFCIPLAALVNYVPSGGGQVVVGLFLVSTIPVPPGSQVFRNGVLSQSFNLLADNATWAYVNLSTTGFGTGLTPGAPTGKVGANPVTGTATTFMRSDAAPVIDAELDINWLGTHTFEGTAGGGILAPTMEVGDNSQAVANCEFIANTVASSAASITFCLQPNIIGDGSVEYPSNAAMAWFAIVGPCSITSTTAKAIFRASQGPISAVFFNIQKNGTTFGRIDFAANAQQGVTSIQDTDFVAGDVITIVFINDTVDNSLRGLYGTVVVDKPQL